MKNHCITAANKLRKSCVVHCEN